MLDEIHMLDTECFSFLNRALENEMSPILIVAINKGFTTIRGTNNKSVPGISGDLLERLFIIKTDPYTEDEMKQLAKSEKMTVHVSNATSGYHCFCISNGNIGLADFDRVWPGTINTRHPLPITSSNGQQKSKHEFEGSLSNTMAARLRRHGNKNISVINSGNAWSVVGRGLVQTSSIHSYSKKSTNHARGGSKNSSQTKTVVSSGSPPSSYANPIPSAHRIAHGQLPVGPLRDTRDNVSKLPTSSQLLNVENVQSANKSLVDKIRSALDFDEDRYTIFKDISAQYRQGTIDTDTYVGYVQQFGLFHLVLELARLCPDARKQRELMD